MKHSILLTGATGYLGIHFVQRLLRQANIEKVFCTTRQKNPALFWSALESSSKQYELKYNESDLKKKIEPVELDLVKDRDSMLNILEKYKKEITAVHHLACETNYAVKVEVFKPWVDITERFVDYCMDSQYPKQLHTTGSYGHHLVEHKHTDDDFYWINGYFGYKKWLHNYLKKKFAEGLKGVLFEPGYVIGPVDPGQIYMFWRVVRVFATLERGFRYRMLLTPMDMLLDHYILALENPDPGPNVVCPFVPEPFHMPKLIQDVLPNLKIIEFEEFRQLVKENLPKRAKYFGPNMLHCMDSTIMTFKADFHPKYDVSKYKNVNQLEYLMTCRSFNEALKLAEQDRLSFMKTKMQQAN